MDSEFLLTTLSYSGGVQSHCILEMILRGDLEKPKNFVVINADPGMEDARSYEFVKQSKIRCAEVGIDFITAAGPNLYEDLLNVKNLKRIENPAYFTKNTKTGKMGKLPQHCTRNYKIRPMQRALRIYMNQKFGVSLVSRRIPKINTWIGFAADEIKRCKGDDPKVRFIHLSYPLIEKNWDKLKVEGYYLKNGIEKPPRSVCIACFANGLSYFEDMFLNRPDDWDKAVKVDEAIRNLEHIKINDEVFVSNSWTPLKDLPALNFKKYDENYKSYKCNNGFCFL